MKTNWSNKSPQNMLFSYLDHKLLYLNVINIRTDITEILQEQIL